jgi:hypothetical protein
MEESVTTLTLGFQLNVKCKGTWGQNNVFKSETHFSQVGEKCKRLSPMTPNDLCNSPKYSEPWLKKQLNIKLGPQDTIEKVSKWKCLNCLHIFNLELTCMNYDQKKGRESNREFDSWPQIPLE